MIRKWKIILLATIAALLLVVGAFNYYRQDVLFTNPAISSGYYLFFPNDPTLIDPFAKPVFVYESTQDSKERADSAIRDLLAGPSEELIAEGYFNPFIGKNKPLLNYYSGLRLEYAKVILSFDTDALDYLNAPAAEQLLIKESIERTLWSSLGVQNWKIEYEINGEIYTEWDA